MAVSLQTVILYLIFIHGLNGDNGEHVEKGEDRSVSDNQVYEVRFALIDNVVSSEDTTLVDGNYRVSLNRHTVRNVMFVVIASVMVATAIFVMIRPGTF